MWYQVIMYRGGGTIERTAKGRAESKRERERDSERERKSQGISSGSAIA